MSLFLWSNGTLVPLKMDDLPQCIVVLPGADIALHKVELAETTPARQQLEAEMLASDRCAATEDVQVAAGPERDGKRWLAIMDRARLVETLDAIRAQVEPTALLPAALLLPEGTTAGLDGLQLFHGATFAGAFTPALAAALPGSAAFRPAPFPPDPMPPMPPLPLNLLQGDFRPRNAWWRTRRFQWQAGALFLLAATLLLLPTGLQQWRTAAGARQLDRETVALATESLPKEVPFADATAATGALSHASKVREAHTLGAPLAYVAQNMAGVPGVALTTLEMTKEGPAFTFEGPATALNTLANRLQGGPFTTRREGTRLVFTGRPAANPDTASGRFLAASSAATLLKAVPLPRPLMAADVLAALQAAGLDNSTLEGDEVVVPAARANVLLPLLLTLEKQGLRVSRLSLQRNSDQTVALYLVPLGVSR